MSQYCPRCGEDRSKVTLGNCKHPWHLAVVLANRAEAELGPKEQWDRIFSMLRDMRRRSET